MPGPERSFAQQKTCPNPDKGSRLATTPQTDLWTREQITYGALATRHPLGAGVEGRKNDALLHHITTYEQILVPLRHRRVRRLDSRGKDAKPCRPANQIKARQRRQQRGYLQQVKGISSVD